MTAEHVDPDRREQGNGRELRITHGGRPAPVELAALVAALDTGTAGDGCGGRQELSGVPAWRRAALAEGTGADRIGSLVDLAR